MNLREVISSVPGMRGVMVCGVGAIAVLMSGGAASAAISGASNAHALSADVHLVSTLVGIDVGPLPSLAATSPNPYSTTQTVASASASALGVASLGTGLLRSTVTSDVAAMSSTGMAFGSSQVNGLGLRIVPGLLPILDVVNLGATTIGSDATVSFDGVNLVRSGGIIIEDADLHVAGVGVITIDANAAPNTVLLDALGIRIVLNEQILSGVGDTASIEVNAIHITIDSPLQLVAADVVIGHSFASLTIPAPGSVACIAGGGLLVLRRRRR